jgi:hypothetical protein
MYTTFKIFCTNHNSGKLNKYQIKFYISYERLCGHSINVHAWNVVTVTSDTIGEYSWFMYILSMKWNNVLHVLYFKIFKIKKRWSPYNKWSQSSSFYWYIYYYYYYYFIVIIYPNDNHHIMTKICITCFQNYIGKFLCYHAFPQRW